MARRAKKKMLSGATDYTLLQMKHARENQLKEAASYRDRSRVVEITSWLASEMVLK